MINEREAYARYQRAYAVKSSIEPYMNELARRMLPKADNFYVERYNNKQASRYRPNYDNTGMILVQEATKRIMKSVAPRGDNYVQIEVNPLLKQRLDKQTLYMVEKAADDATLIFYSYLDNSNFLETLRAICQEWIVFGNVARPSAKWKSSKVLPRLRSARSGQVGPIAAAGCGAEELGCCETSKAAVLRWPSP